MREQPNVLNLSLFFQVCFSKIVPAITGTGLNPGSLLRAEPGGKIGIDQLFHRG